MWAIGSPLPVAVRAFVSVLVLTAACAAERPRSASRTRSTIPVAVPASTCRLNPWNEQLGGARIITAHRMPTHELLVLDDGSLRTFDGFGSVHRERSRCDTGLMIVAATRHDDGYEVLTAEGNLWRVRPSPCRKSQLRASGVPEGMTSFRVCDELLVAQHRDEVVRLWSASGELLDEAPPPGRSAQSWIVRERPCALCLNDTCYEPRHGWRPRPEGW